MTRRQNLAAAAASFAVAVAVAVAVAAAGVAVPAGAGGMDDMQPMMGDRMGTGDRDQEAIHGEMHDVCHRMMASHERADRG